MPPPFPPLVGSAEYTSHKPAPPPPPKNILGLATEEYKFKATPPFPPTGYDGVQ